MGYFYVDENTGTGGVEYATQQTGTFATLGAANLYASIEAAITGGASDIDIVCCSHLHDYSKADAITYTGGTAKALTIVSVDDANCDIAKDGAKETTSTFGDDVLFANLVKIQGLTLISEDVISILFTGEVILLENVTLKLNVSSNYIGALSDGAYLQLDECTIDLNHEANYFLVQNGFKLVINGGSVIFTTDVTGRQLTNVGFINGGGTVNVAGTDLSAITDYLINNAGGALTTEDYINVTIDKCLLNSGLTAFNDETFVHKAHTILVTQSSSDSASAEYQYYYHTRGGVVDDNVTVYRDESTAYAESSKKVSLKCLTDGNAESAIPFEFEFPTRFAELSTATDTVRIYLACATALDDSDVYAKLTYPDGTTKNVSNMVNSLGTPSDTPSDPFRTVAALTADTGSTWKDGAGDYTGNEYYIDLDTSADAGSDCVPKISMFVSIPSTAIYFDTSVGVV